MCITDLAESDDIHDYHGRVHRTSPDDVALDGGAVGHRFVGVDASGQLFAPKVALQEFLNLQRGVERVDKHNEWDDVLTNK